MQAYDLLEHVEDVYAEKLGLTTDSDQTWDDRILGYNNNGERVVITVRFVGHDNAARFRRWITVPPATYDSMTRRPNGWRFYVLMVGFLPDGTPWWTTLYDERVLARPDVYPFAEVMGAAGRFYRFDPHLAEKALIAEFDFTDRQQPLPHDHQCKVCDVFWTTNPATEPAAIGS